MGLKADAEAERTVINQLNHSEIPVEIPGPRLGCRSPRCRVRAGSQLILSASLAPNAERCRWRLGAPANAPRARQLLRGPGARDWQPPASAAARPPIQDKVQHPTAPAPPPPPPLRPAGIPRGTLIRPRTFHRRCRAARLQVAAVCAVLAGAGP